MNETLLQMSYSFLAILIAYLLGSLSFAVIVSRFAGLSDPRTYGSKNPGATNVLRSGSKSAAMITLILDALKGWLPVFAVGYWGSRYGFESGTQALVGLAAFLGHLFPVFFRFAGGKGVATALGVLLGFDAILGLCVLLIFLLVIFIGRYVSFASIFAAISAPLVYVIGWKDSEINLTIALGLIAVLLAWRHEANIKRLINGTEPKLGQKKQDNQPNQNLSQNSTSLYTKKHPKNKTKNHSRKK